jgi:hypothetical protein
MTNDTPKTKRRYTCSACGEQGHQGRSCPYGKKLGTLCGLCGERGHNRRGCPALVATPEAGVIEIGHLVVPVLTSMPENPIEEFGTLGCHGGRSRVFVRGHLDPRTTLGVSPPPEFQDIHAADKFLRKAPPKTVCLLPFLAAEKYLLGPRWRLYVPQGFKVGKSIQNRGLHWSTRIETTTLPTLADLTMGGGTVLMDGWSRLQLYLKRQGEILAAVQEVAEDHPDLVKAILGEEDGPAVPNFGGWRDRE